MRHSLSQCITLACLLEVSASKPGNVHRGADFDDLTFVDFLASATAIGEPLAQAAQRGVGAAILEAVQATHRVVKSNSNLGMILLLAPLAAVPRERSIEAGIGSVLRNMGAADAADVWQAITLAQPGGLGQVAENDLSGPPPTNLLEAMQAAANHDSVAAQYVTDYRLVLDCVAPWLSESYSQSRSILAAIVYTHVRLMAEYPDTLIARKAGAGVARESARWAHEVLRAFQQGYVAYHDALSGLDFWLRSDGRKRNPGTTADLIAAGLFVLLRDDKIVAPYR